MPATWVPKFAPPVDYLLVNLKKMKFENWDLDTLSEEQLVQLGQKVEEAKELRKATKTYEVTFKVSFLPFLHRHGSDARINSLCDFKADLSNQLCQFVDDVFALERPEGVSDIRVKIVESDDSKEPTTDPDNLIEGIQKCQEGVKRLIESGKRLI